MSLLQQAQAVSTDTKVRVLHPDRDDTDVRAEVERILTETGQALPDPMQALPRLTTGRGRRADPPRHGQGPVGQA
ncbi:hypothetical protein GCM10009753_72150 [Streptantibioticus ferralitis]